MDTAGSAPRHMTPCACHCAACRAAGHSNNMCVMVLLALVQLFPENADIVDLVLRPPGAKKEKQAQTQAQIQAEAATQMDPQVGGGEARQVSCPSLSLSLSPSPSLSLSRQAGQLSLSLALPLSLSLSLSLSPGRSGTTTKGRADGTRRALTRSL
jgi:hypothetical protein